MKRLIVFCGLALAIGCGKSQFIDGFKPAPVQAGFTRFVTPIIENIKPGDNVLYCQWLQAPLDHDVDVVLAEGQQSKGGHHIIPFATSATAPVGTSRLCGGSDMLSIRFLGGVAGAGGEGTVVSLPPGVAFRLPAGYALMANTHFINATNQTIDGQAILDMQFADADPSRQIAGMFVNQNDTFSIPPSQGGTADATCVAQKDMNFFAFANHMHEMGTSAFSEWSHAGAAPQQLVQDTAWLNEFIFNPHFVTWPVGGLLQVKAGDTLHTHCEWNNITDAAVSYPGEMCVGVGFFLPAGANDYICSDTQWSN